MGAKQISRPFAVAAVDPSSLSKQDNWASERRVRRLSGRPVERGASTARINTGERVSDCGRTDGRRQQLFASST